MPLNTTEKQFESDIAAALLSPAGGYTRNGDCYDPKLGLFVDTLIRFVQKTQPNEWAFFEKQNPVNPVRKFCTAFNLSLIHIWCWNVQQQMHQTKERWHTL